jgi:hypothetical protein
MIAAAKIRFGADDQPLCPECNGRTSISRRAPHPTLGYDFERQIFTCHVCNHEIERNANALGEITLCSSL